MDCNGICLSLTGYDSTNCTAVFDKKMTHVNFINNANDKSLFKIDIKCSFTITIEDSLLFSPNLDIISRNNNVFEPKLTHY